MKSTRWQEPWFMALPSELKLLWVYVCDTADAAAVWIVNKGLAEYQIGARMDWGLAIESFKGQILVLSAGEKWYLKEVLSSQHPAGLGACKFHTSIKRLLITHKVDQQAWPGGGVMVVPEVLPTQHNTTSSPSSSGVVGGGAEGVRPEPTALIPKADQFRKFLTQLRLAHDDDHVQEWLGFARECGCSSLALTESCIESVVRQARKDNIKVRFVSHVEHLGPGWKKWNEKRETERIAKEST